MSPRARRIATLAAFAVALPGLVVDRPMFFAAWLAAWWFVLGLVLGALLSLWIHTLTGGRWGDLLLLGLPLVLGADALWPWLGRPDAAALDAITRPAFQRAWFAPAFLASRLVAYAVVWWWLAQPGALVRPQPRRAAASLLVHAGVTSLAAIDLLVALTPQWISTGFPLVALAAQAIAGSAFLVALTLHARSVHLAQPEPHAPPITRDLGNLLLTWVMGWAYLAFVEFLIVWAEDLPRETAWFLPRLEGGWSAVGLVLVGAQFALPFLLLLFRAVKDTPRRLKALACFLVGAGALDAAWIVLPSVEPGSWTGWWLVPALLVGMGLLLIGDADDVLRAAAVRPGTGTDGTKGEWGHVAA